MSKLTALKKQIAALEAQAERIAKQEMSSAIAKVKDIMAEFNLTIEHLTQDVDRRRGPKKAKAKAKSKGVSVAKYADPKTGKTWSGFGRAPGWIAGAKNREAFLVDKAGAADSTAKAPAPARKAAAKAPKAVKKAARPVTKKRVATAKKASGAKAAPLTAKKTATKKIALKKAAPKGAASKRSAAESVVPTATPAA